jgi:hypothetical protein
MYLVSVIRARKAWQPRRELSTQRRGLTQVRSWAMSDVTPSPSKDRGPYGVLFWMLVNAKTSAEQAAHECDRALMQLEYIRREIGNAAAGELGQISPGASYPDG